MDIDLATIQHDGPSAGSGRFLWPVLAATVLFSAGAFGVAMRDTGVPAAPASSAGYGLHRGEVRDLEPEADPIFASVPTPPTISAPPSRGTVLLDIERASPLPEDTLAQATSAREAAPAQAPSAARGNPSGRCRALIITVRLSATYGAEEMARLIETCRALMRAPAVP